MDGPSWPMTWNFAQRHAMRLRTTVPVSRCLLAGAHTDGAEMRPSVRPRHGPAELGSGRSSREPPQAPSDRSAGMLSPWQPDRLLPGLISGQCFVKLKIAGRVCLSTEAIQPKRICLPAQRERENGRCRCTPRTSSPSNRKTPFDRTLVLREDMIFEYTILRWQRTSAAVRCLPVRSRRLALLP